MRRPAVSIPLVFFFLFFVASIYLIFLTFVGIYDEGISSYGAVRVLQGDIPYRDFWTCYGPAQFYVLAIIFKIFGTSLIVERLWLQVVFFSFFIVFYLILNKFCSRKITLIGMSVIFLLLINYSAIVFASINPMFPAFLLCIASCFFLLNFFSDGSKRGLVLSGLCVAAGTLFRPELGLVIFFLEMSIAAVFFYLNTGKVNNAPFKVFDRSRVLFWYLFSFLVILIPVLIFFISCCKPSELFFYFIIFPMDYYARMRGVPFFSYLFQAGPTISSGLFFDNFPKMIFCSFPVAVFISGVVFLTGQAVRFRIKNEIPLLWYGCVLFSALALICFKYSSTRVDFAHFFPLLCTTTILSFLLFSNFPKMKYLRLWLSSLIFLFFLAISINLISELKTIFILKVGTFDIKRAQGLSMMPDDLDLQKAVLYIQKNVPRGEKIFVGSISHDRVMINTILFYFLSERGSPTKYYEFEPGITTTKEVQQKISEDIESAKVRFVVLHRGDWWGEPNESSKSSGVQLLDKYLHHNFKVIEKFGNYLILHRDLWHKDLL